jgi:GH18 family chitinase
LIVVNFSSASGVDLVGYVPNYRMGDSNFVNNMLPEQLGLLDEVRYYGITVSTTGGLTTTQSNLNHIQTIKQKINLLPIEKRPRLGITLGGEGNSGNFSTVVANPAFQASVAAAITSLLDQTGAVGVDIDWEHPAEGVELNTRYPEFLSQIKQSIGPDRRVYATVSPEKILPASVFTGPTAIDGVSVMTYDLGWWGNDPANPTQNQSSLPQYVVDSVDAWTNPVGTSIPRYWVFGNKKSIDAPEDRLGIGSPFYGRGYNGTSAETAVAYRDLVANGTTTDGNAYVHDGSNLWLPGPELVADRVAYAAERGLQHVIFWEMWHDLPPDNPNSLLRSAYNAKLALAAAIGDFNADGKVDAVDLQIWTNNYGNIGGEVPVAGDADGDGDVDGRDFLIWQRHVTIPDEPMTSSLTVPEPACHWLAFVVVLTSRFVDLRTFAHCWR